MEEKDISAPLALSFEDEDDLSSNTPVEEVEEDVKIYELKDELPKELALGEEITTSAPLITSFATVILEDEEEEIAILPVAKPEQESAPSSLDFSVEEVASEDAPQVEQAPISSVPDNTQSELNGIDHSATLDPTSVETTQNEISTASVTQLVTPYQKIPATSKTPLLSNSSKLYLIGGIFALLLLFGINFIIFGSKLFRIFGHTPPSAVVVPINTVEPELNPVKKDKPKASNLTFSNSVETDIGLFSFEGMLLTDKNEMSIKGYITPPKPKPLTLEEIGRNVQQGTWIKKIEFDRKTLSLESIDKATTTSPARIYYEKDGTGTRMLTTVSLRLTKDKEKSESVILVVDVPAILDQAETSISATLKAVQ